MWWIKGRVPFSYLTLGRQTNDCVTTAGSDTDDAVLQIAAAYEVRGMVETVTSTNDATPGSGTVVNQVQLAYNTFGQLTEEQQSHSGSVGGSTPSVQYAYDSGGFSSNEIRLNQLTYPNGRTIGYSYGTSGGMNDYLNRIDTIQDTSSGTTDLAGYAYLGSGRIVRITYAQPNVWLDLWGGTSGTFTGLDLFNRVIDQQWQNNITGTPADIDRFKYGYDLNSNRQWKQNVVSSAASVPLDEYYNYDNLNRLTAMQRGTLTGGPPFTGIGGTPVAEQDWTLDPTGNWTAFVTKSSGTTTLNQARTANAVNEITAIGGTPGWATPPSYDAAGNMTSFPQPASPSSALTAAYDAWNQMTSVSSGGSTVATYQYDGRGRRIVKVTASISETRHFYYTPNWRDIEERVGTATTMDKQYVWGIRYVDELVCRDDATPHRLYACQDANFSLTAVVNAAGSMAERYVFYPYGGRTIYDETWSPLPSSAYEWVIGHQGLSQDIETGLIYNRIRYLNTALGRPLGRDNAGYRDGANLFQYEMSNPTNSLDPSGECTVAVRCGQVGSAGLYGNHCGLYISDNQGTGYIDGSGGNINQFGGSTTDWPGSTTGQKTSLPDDKCACLRSSMASWNALNVPRDDLTNNSNWSLRCLLRKCGLSVGFSNSDSFPEGSVGQQIPGPQGVQMPQGWNTGYNGTKPACGPPLTNCPPAFDASPGNEWQS